MKKRNRNLGKRALAMFVSLTMCLGMLQITAFAVEEETSPAEPVTEKVATVEKEVIETETGEETLANSTEVTTDDGVYREDTYQRVDTEVTTTVTTEVTKETETKEPEVEVKFDNTQVDERPEDWFDNVQAVEDSEKPEQMELTTKEPQWGPEWYTPQYGNFDDGVSDSIRVETGITYDEDGNPIGADGKKVEKGETGYTVIQEITAETDIIVRDNLDRYTFGATGDHRWAGNDGFDAIPSGGYDGDDPEYMANYPTYTKSETTDDAVVVTTIRPVLEGNKVIGYEKIVETTKIVANGTFKPDNEDPVEVVAPDFDDPSITEVKPNYAEDGKTVVSYDVTSVVLDEAGKVVLDEEGNPVTETKTIERNPDPNASTVLGETTQTDQKIVSEQVAGTLEGNKVETKKEVTQNIVQLDIDKEEKPRENAALSVKLTVSDIKDDTSYEGSTDSYQKYKNNGAEKVIDVNCFTGASVTVMQPEENKNTAEAKFTFELEKSKFDSNQLMLVVNGKKFPIRDRDSYNPDNNDCIEVMLDPGDNDGKYKFSVKTTLDLQDGESSFELSLVGKSTIQQKDTEGKEYYTDVDVNLHQTISVSVTEIKNYIEVKEGTQVKEGTVDTKATAQKTTTITQETTTRFLADTMVKEESRVLPAVTRTERTRIGDLPTPPVNNNPTDTPPDDDDDDDDDDDVIIPPDPNVPLGDQPGDTTIDDGEVPLAQLPDQDGEEVVIPDDEVPLAEMPEEDGEEVEIPDDEVPLADVPETGDISAMWYAVTVLSACGLIALNVLKKREEA